jgi:SNF2 family DNA or RNA helicase
MSSLLLLRPAVGGAPWDIDAVPYAYEAAGQAQFKAMPGVRWVTDRSAPNGRGFYRGAREAVEIVAATLEAAKVAKVRSELPELQPDRGSRAPGGDFDQLGSLGLRDYQVDGCCWLRWMLRCTGGALLADDMGLGKSAQALVATASLLQPGRQVTIVCPASVRSSWHRQIARWCPELADRAFVYGYEAFAKAFKKAELPAVDALIIDEIHYAANPSAQRTQALVGYRGHVPFVLGLSGTPMTDNPNDLWQPLDLLHPGRWGSASPTGPRRVPWLWQRRYCDGHEEEISLGGGEKRNVWVAKGTSRPEELAARLQAVMLRRTKAQVAAELPAIVRHVVDVELPRKARSSLTKAARAIDWSGQGRQGVGTLLKEAEAYKLETALEIAVQVTASGGRPLLLTTRRRTAEELGARLGCPWVHGDTEPAKRVPHLASGSGPGAATIDSVGTGVDGLQALFDTVIFVGLDWLPSKLLQAEARLHRLGQLGVVTAYYLIGMGTLDEVVRERVIDRLDAFEAIVGASDGAAMAESLRGGSEEDLIAALVAAAAA